MARFHMVLFCILVSTPSSFLGNRSPINYPYDRVCLFCKHFVMGDKQQFLNVWENIILPAGIDGKSLDKAFACELLERLELSAKKSSFPEELSIPLYIYWYLHDRRLSSLFHYGYNTLLTHCRKPFWWRRHGKGNISGEIIYDQEGLQRQLLF